MAASGKKSFCVLEYHTSKSVVTVQHDFRAKSAKDPPIIEYIQFLSELEKNYMYSYCIINTLRTGDADLRFYITTVQDG